MKWSHQQRENRNLLSIFYLALQSVSSSCVFYFRNSVANTEVGTKVGAAGKQKALKSCDFKAFYWWGKVDSNHRSHWQQIYSLSPLATREFPHIHFAVLILKPSEAVSKWRGERRLRIWSFSLLRKAERSKRLSTVELVDGFEPPTCWLQRVEKF